MSIRRARSEDADAVTSLYVEARRAAALAGAIPSPAHTDEEVADWIGACVIPGRECWLAEHSCGEVVGLLVLEKDWVDQLYVHPELTGRGVGLRLLEVAKRRRPHGLQLWTFVSNEGAQRFYERHGFSEVQRTDGTGNEERSPDIRYVWPSAPSSS